MYCPNCGQKIPAPAGDWLPIRTFESAAPLLPGQTSPGQAIPTFSVAYRKTPWRKPEFIPDVFVPLTQAIISGVLLAIVISVIAIFVKSWPSYLGLLVFPIVVGLGWCISMLNDRGLWIIEKITGRDIDQDNEPKKRIIEITDQFLVICNGEASTVVAQHFGVAAVAITGGSEKPTVPHALLTTLKAAYTGSIIVALDCDQAGHANAPRLAQFLIQAGYQARAVDLDLGNDGADLADFCRLYQREAAARLQTLKEIAPPKPKDFEAKIKSADWLAALATLGYSFRLNILDDTVEVNESPLTDILIAQIRTRMRDIGYIKYLGAMEDAYTTVAANNPYHPIKAYLESLKWDGKPYIDTLATYFTDTQGIFGLWLKKWLVRAVGKVYGQAQNYMFVLE